MTCCDARCGDAGGAVKDGTPCRGFLNLSPTNGLCVQHDPERREMVEAMRSTGGRSARETRAEALRANAIAHFPRPPRTLEDAARMSAWTSWAALTGEIPAQAADANTRALKVFTDSMNKAELSRRIRELEKKIKALEQRRAAA